MINPNVLRRKVLDMVYEKKSGHIGGSFSMAELTSVLYNDYDIGGKDKFILSKGHAVPIIYAMLHELGRISDEDLSLFREIDSPLQGHPDKLRLPEMDATTGSLGTKSAKKMVKEKFNVNLELEIKTLGFAPDTFTTWCERKRRNNWTLNH